MSSGEFPFVGRGRGVPSSFGGQEIVATAKPPDLSSSGSAQSVAATSIEQTARHRWRFRLPRTRRERGIAMLAVLLAIAFVHGCLGI